MQPTPVTITLIAVKPKEFYATTVLVGVALAVVYYRGKRAGAKEAAKKTK